MNPVGQQLAKAYITAGWAKFVPSACYRIVPMVQTGVICLAMILFDATDGLVQDYSISSVLAMEVRKSCTKPPIRCIKKIFSAAQHNRRGLDNYDISLHGEFAIFPSGIDWLMLWLIFAG